MDTIKGISLTQPWASLVATGAKSIETRSWPTRYRGWLAIHAAKSYPGWARELAAAPPFSCHLHGRRLPTGAVVALARLVDVAPTSRRHGGEPACPFAPAEGTEEFEFGDYSEGRFMWRLEGTVPLETPVPCKGALGLWRIPDPVLDQLREAYREAFRAGYSSAALERIL